MLFTNDLNQEGEKGIPSYSHFVGIIGQSLLFLSDKEREWLFRLMSYMSDPFVSNFNILAIKSFAKVIKNILVYLIKSSFRSQVI